MVVRLDHYIGRSVESVDRNRKEIEINITGDVKVIVNRKKGTASGGLKDLKPGVISTVSFSMKGASLRVDNQMVFLPVGSYMILDPSVSTEPIDPDKPDRDLSVPPEPSERVTE